jgi:hypothetical protein
MPIIQDDEIGTLISKIKRRHTLVTRLKTTFAIVAGLTTGWLAGTYLLPA